MATEPPKTLAMAVKEISDDASIPAEPKAKMLAALQPIVPVLQTDVWIYRLVVIFLGLVVLFTVLGDITLMMTNQVKGLPDGIIAIGSAAIGALAGLLAPSPVSKQ